MGGTNPNTEGNGKHGSRRRRIEGGGGSEIPFENEAGGLKKEIPTQGGDEGKRIMEGKKIQ